MALGSFAVLGLPDGMLGPAWPEMRQTFGAPIAALGLILLVSTGGSVAISAFVGWLIQRIGVPALLATAGICAALGGAGFALAPGLWLILAVAVLVGVAAGMMDGGLNTAIGLAGRPRLLNLLHAAYGVGTTIGPLLITVAIVTGSWRPAYAVLSALDLVIATLWLRQRRSDRLRAALGPATSAGPLAPTRTSAPEAPATPSTPANPSSPRTPVGPTSPSSVAGNPHPSEGWSRRRASAAITAGMVLFFVYTGVEVGAGQWEASYCRGHLGLSASAAAIATFFYWAAFTGARIALAVLPRQLELARIIRWGSVLGVVGAAAIWWQPNRAIALAGFIVLAGGLSGVFPALIGLTPARIGHRRAEHVIAWQVGAAAAGGSGLSAFLGLLIGLNGLQILGPALTVGAVLLIVANYVLARVAPIAPGG
ncbi:MAG TPA: MFS transporter [Streptosporangiaceae bacterium]